MIAVYALGAAALVLVLAQSFGFIDGPQAGTLADLALWTVLLAVLAVGMRGAVRGRMGQTLSAVAIWVGLGAVLVTGYTYRTELAAVFDRVGGELTPGRTAVVAGGDYEIQRSRHGHYEVRAVANDVPLRFLVDTGASHTTLSHGQAAQAGLDVAALDYRVPVQTANGLTYAAKAKLERFVVGTIEMKNLDILVAQPGALRSNLLGLNFLDRLDSYEVRRGRMTLRAPV